MEFSRRIVVTMMAGAFVIAPFGLRTLDAIQDVPEPEEPRIAAASDEGDEAIAGFKYPDNLKATLFAAEPDVANPVALTIDHQGRLFVCESFRQEKGVEDNRRHPYWLDEELAAQTVADRVVYMKKHFENWNDRFQSQDDQIRLIEDTDKDGVADSAKVFSNGYNEISMGTGAGVLHYRGDVFYTCIPDLWLLSDIDNDGIAESRKSLHKGFGVRFAFRGHDMHGLIIGPDGRLYFSIGDRGYNLGEDFRDPTSGAVFRCELDGSHLEIVATGLRNPQELAFDDHGNLFTGDNNSDSGDKARWVYIVEGSDSGWRMYYQYLGDRGPFNRESIWKPYDADSTPAYIVPPIDNISDGPSGLAYYPGTGFGDQFDDRFFLCDFRGTATVSGIRSFKNQPDGAFFKVSDMDQTIWQLLATDIDFGPDGKMYVADWIFGWIGENKGRVYTFHDPEESKSQVVKQVQALLAGGIEKLDVPELAELLGHKDRRIRQEAQFELVRRGEVKQLLVVAAIDKRQLARLHAMWGIGQLTRRQIEASDNENNSIDGEVKILLTSLLGDDDSQVRAHAAKLSGDLLQKDMADSVSKMLADSDLRVRHFAAMALSKIGNVGNLSSVANLLAENNNQDPIVRHSGIMALKGIASSLADPKAEILALAKHESAAVRLATVVALRKMKSDLVATFLNDSNARVKLEAARVIHDLPLADLMPRLAALISEVDADDALVRRAINANVHAGTNENAAAIALFAANANANLDRRLDALTALANWENPPSRDAVLGDWRPIKTRDANVAREALAKQFATICGENEKLRAKAIEAAGILKLQNIDEVLVSIVKDGSAASSSRAAALNSLAAVGSEKLTTLVDDMLPQFGSLPGDVAGALTMVAAKLNPRKGMDYVQLALEGDATKNVADDILRKQMAIRALGEMSDGSSADKLSTLMNAVANTDYVGELRLDVINSVEKRKEDFFASKLADYRKSLENPESPSAMYRDALFGGNEEAGRKIFREKTEVSCVRCHNINSIGGEVGPELSTIAADKDRQYLLEAIIEPNKVIAEGYAQMVVATIDGLTFTGVVSKKSDDLMLRLMDAEGQLIAIPRDDIEDSRMGLSSMPTDIKDALTMTELRDLIEYLANRKKWEDDRPNPGIEGHE